MTDQEIEKYRQRLVDINKMKDFQERKRQLKELAREVGAGQARYFVKGNEDTLSELTDNINDALRTEAMIAACKTSAKNYKIAIVAAIVAFLSMLAAWAAVVAAIIVAVLSR